MKKFVSLFLVCVLALGLLSGCDRKPSSEEPAAQDNSQVVNFAPETTAVVSEQQPVSQAPVVADYSQESPADVSAEQEPVAQDATLEPVPAETETAAPEIQPFATATPQPNTQISNYTEISNTGLGFKFSHPSDWDNIPGRSTVCFVQPLENGTEYPARVAVTMKKLPHKCGDETLQIELAEYVKVIRGQYDEKTFEVSKELDTSTKFMGKKGYSATYLAYDGNQEIQGYIIATYFERYVFVYHFLSAYEDFEAFGPAMRRMRDSVQAEQSSEN